MRNKMDSAAQVPYSPPRSRFKLLHQRGFTSPLRKDGTLFPRCVHLIACSLNGRFARYSIKKRRIMSNVSTGTVKWFNETKGFGFITPTDGGEDLFAHFKEIQGNGFKTLTEGQRVEFVPARGQKGMQATQIRPV